MSHSEQGHYSDAGLPVVDLRVLGRESLTYSIEAIVDTGFNGTVLVFEADARAMGWAQTSRFHDVFLADGSACRAYWTTAHLSWFGEKRAWDVLVIPKERPRSGNCLVGMGLLRGTSVLLGGSKVEVRPEA